MIVLIDNYDSFTYNLYQALRNQDKPVTVIRNDQQTVSEISAYKPTQIIVSPGPGRPEAAGICVSLIQQLYQQIPILGVCLGHQAIASAFGGRIVHADTVRHGKASDIFHRRQGLFQSLPLPLRAARYHSLVVSKADFPPVLQIDAEDEQGQIMAIKHRDYPCYGVQFHPESILTPDGDRLIHHFLTETS